MYRRLVIVVLFTLYLKPAAAANPAMDFSLSMSYMEQFQPDLEGTLRCIECALSCWDCVCVLSQSSSSYLPALTIEPTHYTPPSTNDYNPTVDLSDLVHWMEDARLPLFDNTIQFMNANETTVQSTTVQAHVESIYTPGDRQRRPSPKRQALRKGGYACNIIGCNKAFDRACELNRHTKIHLSRSERPHKCTVCREGFLYPKDLTRHRQKHVKQASAKITYYCSVSGCGNIEGFSRRDNLLRHHRRQHEGVASP